eukprot:1037824-Lingulodinium_polyedra.AAC.1
MLSRFFRWGQTSCGSGARPHAISTLMLDPGAGSPPGVLVPSGCVADHPTGLKGLHHEMPSAFCRQ